MKIALLDLTHNSFGVTTNTVPLAIGGISAYIQRHSNVCPQIRLFKDAAKALADLSSWRPQLIGISLYAWNSNLNLYVASLLKKENPNCIIVAGGPNQAIEPLAREQFLQLNRCVDLCVIHDGEIPLLEIVNRIVFGENSASLKRSLVAGCYCIDEAGCYTEAPGIAPRLTSLDEFGSVYADGYFDEFLDSGYMPFMQTHRGCPFTCAFCYASKGYMRNVLFQSPEIFKKDLEHLARRFAGRDDVTLYLANNNWSMFREDFEIAEIIQQTQSRFGWPRYFNVNSGKHPRKLLDMLSIISFEPGIALQTLTPNVLKNIRRKNIPFADYVSFQKEVFLKTGIPSATEIIMSLPGETKETFLETTKKVLDSGVQNIIMLTFMNLKGTPTSSSLIAEQYGHVFKYRVVPRQYSILNGSKIFDTEEVIVETRYMSYRDYLELRELYFTILVFFNSLEFMPIRKLLLEKGVLLSDWIFHIHKKFLQGDGLFEYRHAFIRETREELFDSESDLVRFYQNETFFNELTKGLRGDNLSRKYKMKTLSEAFPQCLEIAIESAKQLLGGGGVETENLKMLFDLKAYLLFRDLKGLLSKDTLGKERQVTLSYAIPNWLASTNTKDVLDNYKGNTVYLVSTSTEQEARFAKALKSYKEPSLSLQILYRDGMIRDFWPLWRKMEVENDK